MMEEKLKKILVIEDDKFISEVYLTKLSTEGFDTVVVNDGEAGLKEAKKKLPDLILLDIFMPKKGGIEVLRVLKEDEVTRNIPVIMITNATEDEYIDQAMEMGAVDYLVKSNFTPDEVVNKVLQYCN